MKAVQFPEPGKVNIIEIPDVMPGPEEVLLKINYIGLCGGDLNTYRGTFAMVTYPRIPGHEVSAVIQEKGRNVPEKYAVGREVTVSPYLNCGACSACRAGRPNCCQYNQTLGVQRDGALTERISVPFRDVFLSDRLSQEELALIEPLSVGYHAANRGRISEKDTVLVLGCGTIGLGVIAAASYRGATVIGADIFDEKLKMALEFGATFTVNTSTNDAVERVKEINKGEGVDVAVEAVGSPVVSKMAVDAAAYAGRVVLIGYTKKETCFETKYFVSKELDILGSRNALGVFPDVIKMIESGRYPCKQLISRIYPFSESRKAFADWKASPGDFNKILIHVEGNT